MMTKNQIAYHSMKEQQRSNLAQETETNRANLAREHETARHNQAGEILETNKAQETARHNKTTENETKRHNRHSEVANYMGSLGTMARGASGLINPISNIIGNSKPLNIAGHSKFPNEY